MSPTGKHKLNRTKQLAISWAARTWRFDLGTKRVITALHRMQYYAVFRLMHLVALNAGRSVRQTMALTSARALALHTIMALAVQESFRATADDGGARASATGAAVHIVYAGDDNSKRDVEMSIRSLLRRARRPDRVKLHYFGDTPLNGYGTVNFTSLTTIAQVYKLDRFQQDAETAYDGNKNPAANFLRFALPDIFPTLEKIIWLDTDTFFKCDVADLFDSVLQNSVHPIAMVSSSTPFKSIDFTKIDSPLAALKTSWKGGVFVINLAR